jgi:hypothetical protein
MRTVSQQQIRLPIAQLSALMTGLVSGTMTWEKATDQYPVVCNVAYCSTHYVTCLHCSAVQCLPPALAYVCVLAVGIVGLCTVQHCDAQLTRQEH